MPRDIASRQAKNVCDEGRGVGPMVGDFRRGVYLDFADAIDRLGRAAVEAKYGNLFDMYARITGENPYEVPMRIYPAVHYVMGGLWVDYDLQSTIPGLFVTGEANFSDHGANRLGASALMQGLADGYFVLPQHDPRLPRRRPVRRRSTADAPGGRRGAHVGRGAHRRSSSTINGDRSVDSFHKELGNIMWEYCGMERTEEGLLKAIDLIRGLREEFWRNVQGARRRRHPQPEPREGRPGGRLPRARRADVHRRAAPPRVLRRPLPGRVARPRTARRCGTTTSSPTSRPGSSPADGDGEMSPSCTRKTSSTRPSR